MSTPHTAVTWLSTTGSSTTRTATLPPTPLSARRAREFVWASLDAAGATEAHIADRIGLVTSELVTNAIVHARTDLEVLIQISGPEVYVEVADGTPSLVAPQRPIEDTGGRGLVLVAALSDAWGVAEVDQGRGKRVWVRVSRS
jgi:anti-sigma regulatory factor (Ser/Thr protein kinase)